MPKTNIRYIEDRDPRIAWRAWKCACGRCFHSWTAVVPKPQLPSCCPTCNAPTSMLTVEPID